MLTLLFVSEQDVEEVTLALFKLLVAIFEHSYTVIIAELSTPRSIALLQRLLLLTCFPGYHDADEQISDIALPIWAYLQEEIADNGVVATQSGLGDPRWPIVKEVFDALVNGLRGKVAFPEDREYESWPKGKLAPSYTASHYLTDNHHPFQILNKASRDIALMSETVSSTPTMSSANRC